MGMKPKYIIFIGNGYAGYYKGSSTWKPVPKEDADHFSHKKANRMEGKLRKLGYKGATLELAKD